MGFRGKHKNRRDANEPELFKVLSAYGLSVHPIDTPADALVGYAGRTWLAEIKGPNAKLTKAQREFYDVWKGNRTILRTIEEAEAFAIAVRNGEA
ncbi:MAG: hypothetical protein EP341_09690 [Sphingomonadales bacterium]|nr:MAG: hypothetical protein EP341_09690 [Sphingomonadales bacterium]